MINFLCFTYSKESLDIKQSNEVFGIDLGLKSLYTNSDGHSVNRFSVKLVKKYRKRIEVLNRSLSKKTKGSNRFNKVKKNLNKTYKRLSSSNNDYLHKKSIELVKKSNDILVVGDIQIQKIIDKSNKGLIKSFYSSSLGKFKEMVKYKCQLNGRQVYFINEAYTSKTCSCCGNIKHNLCLNDRVYSCNNCQNNIDRDHNAAINIKLLGLSIISKEMVVH
jgi:putative transposase